MVRIEGKDFDLKTIVFIVGVILSSMAAYMRTTYTLEQTVQQLERLRDNNQIEHESMGEEISELQKAALMQEGYNAALAAMQNQDGG